MLWDLSHLKEKKCCVSRAYAVCWVTPNFWENALIAEKNALITLYTYIKISRSESNFLNLLAIHIAIIFFNF